MYLPFRTSTHYASEWHHTIQPVSYLVARFWSLCFPLPPNTTEWTGTGAVCSGGWSTTPDTAKSTFFIVLHIHVTFQMIGLNIHTTLELCDTFILGQALCFITLDLIKSNPLKVKLWLMGLDCCGYFKNILIFLWRDIATCSCKLSNFKVNIYGFFSLPNDSLLLNK